MRGSYTLLPLGGTIRWGRVFLLILYALTFYFGPQFGSSELTEQNSGAAAYASGGGPTGYHWMNEFNSQFEYNDL